jgi:hypothetical protein
MSYLMCNEFLHHHMCKLCNKFKPFHLYDICCSHTYSCGLITCVFHLNTYYSTYVVTQLPKPNKRPFNMDVAKLDRGYCTCCICYKCFIGMLQAFVQIVSFVSRRTLQAFLYGCCICFHIYVATVRFKIFHLS